MKLLALLLALPAFIQAAPIRDNLQQDLLDFVELIPLEDLRVVVEKHLRNDLEFQAAIQYFQGPDWETISTSVSKAGEVKDVKKYLINAGLDIDLVFAFLEEFLQDAKIKSHHNRPSLKKFLDDVNVVIPHEKLADLLAEKMDSSPHFQDFYDKLSSERFHKIFEKAYLLPDVQTAVNKLIEMDVPVQPVLQAIYAYLGWPSTNINTVNIRK